ncbi:MAG: PEP-CTERM sorting domain-containing protein [Desulfobacterales bacterium]|nr:PEP-CTERM sorting domain-containing protein [Desulfobacterales bacterium]
MLKIFRVFSFYVLVAFFIVPVSFSAQMYTETWDNGSLEGWLGGTITTEFQVSNTGGNPNGFIRAWEDDAFSSWDISYLTLKNAFTGDYSTAGIGNVSFDLMLISGEFDNAWLRFHGKDYNGWAFNVNADLGSNEWQSFSVPINAIWSNEEARAAGWIPDNEWDPNAVPSPSFHDTLHNVYTAEVRISGNGYIESGIDNFSTIPEPTTMLLLGAGLVGLAGFGRKKFKK